MIVYIYNIGVDLYNGFNGLHHRINWTYFTVLDWLAHPLYSKWIGWLRHHGILNCILKIINSFTIVGTEYKVEAYKGQVVVCNKKVNNAIIENRNKIIECIKNNANGYTNWSRFCNRVMYVLDPNATFSLEPREK